MTGPERRTASAVATTGMAARLMQLGASSGPVDIGATGRLLLYLDPGVASGAGMRPTCWR
jgi:hypothetical protein